MLMSSENRSIYIEKLIKNVLGTGFNDFDQGTIDHAKNRIIDTVGCLIGGANGPGNQGFIDLVRDWGGKEEAAILIHGHKVPVHNAAMINSILARSFDFEPVSPLVDGVSVPGHISGTTIMVALTMGEAMGITGKDLITALLVGDDVASRILVAAGFGFDLGWDCIGTVNAFGASAIAGRLLGLDFSQMRNAFGIVLNQLSGSLQTVIDKTTAFKLCQGLSAQKGIFSAQLAGAGWTGGEDALFGDFGYYHLFTEGCRNPDALTKDLGKKYYSDGTIKPYPCCRINHASIDCAVALAQKNNINVKEIREVHLYVSPKGFPMCGTPFKPGTFPHADAIWSYYYTVSTALMNKCVRPEHFLEDSIESPEIRDIISRIELEELSEANLYQARLQVIMKDGKEFVESTDSAKGDPINNPLTEEEIISKFRHNVAFGGTVTQTNAESLLDILKKLEEIDDVKQITTMLMQ
jgi:2-methylcitrate dehydratase PrpD